ncbi:hypothetical protein OAK48_01680 [Deltaproteobacteria bacterium]|nr:hypothetical protein [Deltaproteobacteria bacterium]
MDCGVGAGGRGGLARPPNATAGGRPAGATPATSQPAIPRFRQARGRPLPAKAGEEHPHQGAGAVPGVLHVVPDHGAGDQIRQGRAGLANSGGRFGAAA